MGMEMEKPFSVAPLLKYVPWESLSGIAHPAVPVVDAAGKKTMDKATGEHANMNERLPLTPKWLRDQEDKWQDKVNKAFQEVDRRKEVDRLKAMQKGLNENDPEIQAEIERLLLKKSSEA